jgi:hypothetical protein
MLDVSQFTGEGVQIAATNIVETAPLTLTERIGDDNGYVPLRSVSTTTATAQEDIFKNIEKNIKRGLPKFESLPDFRNIKHKSKKIAIVGGGPSLKDNLDELRNFDVILVAGSPHDYLLENGINITY